MRQPAGPTHLVAPAGSALRAAAGLLRAIPGTVNLAAVAAAADQSLGTAAHTQEQPGRRRVGVLRTADPLMTNAVVAAILPRHTCPARCGARRRSETRQLGSAPCEPLMVRLLPPHRQPLSPNARTDRGRALPGDGVLWSGLRPSRRTPSPASFRTNAHATGITRILTAADRRCGYLNGRCREHETPGAYFDTVTFRRGRAVARIWAQVEPRQSGT